GLLHQGSIQCPGLVDRFRHDFARVLCERYEERTPTPELMERAAWIAETKYGTTEWLMRR
ncbi:MAG: hypothetical protein M3N48_08165, partial [Verrucomicrobiota bacterium]|nr:hypothetical protein [Verrucomicrobiota bacterium]